MEESYHESETKLTEPSYGEFFGSLLELAKSVPALVNIIVVLVITLSVSLGEVGAQENLNSKWYKIWHEYKRGAISLDVVMEELGGTVESDTKEHLKAYFKEFVEKSDDQVQSFIVNWLSVIEYCTSKNLLPAAYGAQLGDEMFAQGLGCVDPKGKEGNKIGGDVLPAVSEEEIILSEVFRIWKSQERLRGTFSGSFWGFDLRDGKPVDNNFLDFMTIRDNMNIVSELVKRLKESKTVCDLLDEGIRYMNQGAYSVEIDLGDFVGTVCFQRYDLNANQGQVDFFGAWDQRRDLDAMLDKRIQGKMTKVPVFGGNTAVELALPDGKSVIIAGRGFSSHIIVREKRAGSLTPFHLFVAISLMVSLAAYLWKKGKSSESSTRRSKRRKLVKTKPVSIVDSRGEAHVEKPFIALDLQEREKIQEKVLLQILSSYISQGDQIVSEETTTAEVVSFLVKHLKKIPELSEQSDERIGRLLKSEFAVALNTIVETWNDSSRIAGLAESSRIEILVNRPNDRVDMKYSLTITSGTSGARSLVIPIIVTVRFNIDDLGNAHNEINILIVKSTAEPEAVVQAKQGIAQEAVMSENKSDSILEGLIDKEYVRKIFGRSEEAIAIVPNLTKSIIRAFTMGMRVEERRALGNFIGKIRDQKPQVWQEIINDISKQLVLDGDKDNPASGGLQINYTVNIGDLKARVANFRQIIAEKVLLYMAMERGGDWEAFTDEALRVFGGHAIQEKSARKCWISRNVARLQLVMGIGEDSKVSLLAVLTPHGHSGMEA